LEKTPLLVLALFSNVKAGDGTVIAHDPGPDFTRLAFGIGEGNRGGLADVGGFGSSHDFDFSGVVLGATNC
jgi:hypothetical protein